MQNLYVYGTARVYPLVGLVVIIQSDRIHPMSNHIQASTHPLMPMRLVEKYVGSWRNLTRRWDLLRLAQAVEKRFLVALTIPITNSLLLLLRLGRPIVIKHPSSSALFLGSFSPHLLHPDPSDFGRVIEVG